MVANPTSWSVNIAKFAYATASSTVNFIVANLPVTSK